MLDKKWRKGLELKILDERRRRNKNSKELYRGIKIGKGSPAKIKV